MPQMETSCRSLLGELQAIWNEIGESEDDRERMLSELEQECIQVYRRKVDKANLIRVRLHQELADSESELASLFSVLGERPINVHSETRSGTLKEQLEAILPQLEALRGRKEERVKMLTDVKSQIRKISEELLGSCQSVDSELASANERDLSRRRLEDYQAQLQTLLDEKADRMQRILESKNILRDLCAVMGVEFSRTLKDVHPTLEDSASVQEESISNDTLDRFTLIIQSLQEEKRIRTQKLQQLGASLIDLWSVMDSSLEERQLFQHVVKVKEADSEICDRGALAINIVEEAEVEVERLERLKVTKLKEFVRKKRSELEDICRTAHMEPDISTSQDKTDALIDTGMVNLAEILANIEAQIEQAKERALSRKEILDKIEKWMMACEEEAWLDDYNRDENRYNAGRGAHVNLKRAERARSIVQKLPALVEALTVKAKAWEQEKGMHFLYDGVRLLAMLEEYNSMKQEKEEEKRRLREQKKMQEQHTSEKDIVFGSKTSPNKTVSAKKTQGGLKVNGSHGGPSGNRRLSAGGTVTQPGTPELTPRTNGTTTSRPSAAAAKDSNHPVNFAAIPKEDFVPILSPCAPGNDSVQAA
ncbi:hypothetical protein O6H91_15G050000 [Diphasiastrum complanatum]|uniref:Uncharacterized protein n=1 Tax=Diphasiastrum complanatum TaxID=34168 RepID=A0ACC2BI86_DIPCM|nr:hypothetical protein O6H91_15G050000 [Diphasiastrum complanatum]